MKIPAAIVLSAIIVAIAILASSRYTLHPWGDKDVIGVWRLDHLTGSVAGCGGISGGCITFPEKQFKPN